MYMHGLQDAYNKSLVDLSKYFSKEERHNRVKKTLLTGKQEGEKHFYYELSTQKDLSLDCCCSPSGIITYSLCVPQLYYSCVDYSYLTSGKDFIELCDIIRQHKINCTKNYIQNYGDLCIGFYSDIMLGSAGTSEMSRYLTGVVNNEIVFIFNTQKHSIINNMFLEGDYIEIILNTREYRIRLSDYAVEIRKVMF